MSEKQGLASFTFLNTRIIIATMMGPQYIIMLKLSYSTSLFITKYVLAINPATLKIIKKLLITAKI